MSHIVTVGNTQYHVVERSPFEFYITGDMIQNIDEKNDSVVILTQMSDYVFETIQTNGGATNERMMVKTKSDRTNGLAAVPPEGMEQNNTREFLSEEELWDV